MNPRLQAGIELIFDKQAALEQESSLSHVLRQKFALDSNIVKEDRGTENGNAEAGKNDETEEPTIEGGDCIKGLTISSDYNNAKTAATHRRGRLAYAIQQMAMKQAGDPTDTDTTPLNPPPTKGGAPAGALNDASESENNGDPTADQSQKSAAQQFIQYMTSKMAACSDKSHGHDEEERGLTQEEGGTYTHKIASQRRAALISLVSNLR